MQLVMTQKKPFNEVKHLKLNYLWLVLGNFTKQFYVSRMNKVFCLSLRGLWFKRHYSLLGQPQEL